MADRMRGYSHSWLFWLFCLLSSPTLFAQTIHAPAEVATVIIDGINASGSSASGVVGEDIQHSLIDEIAQLMGASAGYAHPLAPNQITMARFYGDQYPAYYSPADRAAVDQITNQYDGGIPRYAAIMAKFCRQVLQRSGARQVNIVGLSMGAYIGRWMIENDYEHLASDGRIARFITVEGVVCGNWPCSVGGALLDQIESIYDLSTVSLQQMSYSWLEDHLHDPRTEMDNPLYANIQVMHWASTNDDLNHQALTLASLQPNDGVQVYSDTYFHEVTARSKFHGQRPTLSHIYATHDSAKNHMGIRAGLVADLTSTRRVRVTLVDAKVKQMPEPSLLGKGEVVFGCRVLSPTAQTLYGITAPINQIDNLGHTIAPVIMNEDERVTLHQVLFDDFVLPGETALNLKFDVREIDFDLIYGIFENPFGDPTQPIDSTDVSVSTVADGDYVHDSDGWNGHLHVETIPYPSFVSDARARNWSLYQ